MGRTEPNFLTKIIFRKKAILLMQKRLALLGEETKLSLNFFMNFRLFASLALFFTILYTNELGIVLAPAISILFYFLIDKVVLTKNVKIAAKKIEEEAVYFFQILTISLDAGNSFKLALEKTTASVNSGLSLKFDKTLTELNYGKLIHEALKDMAETVPSPVVRNIVLNLAEAHMLGASMLESLNNQIDYLESETLSLIKKDLTTIPIKISIISVLIFLPLVLLLVLGPIIIELLNL